MHSDAEYSLISESGETPDPLDVEQSHVGQGYLARNFNESDLGSDDDNAGHILGDGLRREEFLVRSVSERVCWWKIFVLHLLFTWNTRTYEFAAIVLVASAYPKNLTAASIRGVVTTISSMILSPLLGKWIDNSPTKIGALKTTIVINHLSIILLYLCWIVYPFPPTPTLQDLQPPNRPFSDPSSILFTIILLLDTIHALSKIANDLCIDRSWIPSLISSIPDAEKPETSLTQVNSVMKRIDLTCKLVAPSLLPIIVSTIDSRKIWISFLAISTGFILLFELWFAERVSKENPVLRQVSLQRHNTESSLEGNTYHIGEDEKNPEKPFGFLIEYFSTTVWPASFSTAVVQLTVLSYSATLITYLIDIGFPLSTVSMAKASGSIMAIGSTFLTPKAVSFFQKRLKRQNSILSEEESSNFGTGEELGCHDRETAVQMVGLWGILGIFLTLVPVVLSLWYMSPAVDAFSAVDPAVKPVFPLLAFILFTALSLSRLFHWTFDIIVLEITQTSLPPSQLASFAGTEHSFRSTFELVHWIFTIVWSSTAEFKILALGSLTSVACAIVVYYWWLKRIGSAACVDQACKSESYMRLELVERSHPG